MSKTSTSFDNEDFNNSLAQSILTDNEKDALGEIGNICMGTSATTLSTLLGKRVTITTPKVSIVRGNEYLNDYEKPVVVTEVSYIQGIEGNNIFLLKKDDALAITEVLLGTSSGVEELYISAISEVMNQMVGSSATSLSNILQVSVNIAPPTVSELLPSNEYVNTSDEILIKISFLLEIEGLLTSDILQIIPFNLGKKLAATLIGDQREPVVQQAQTTEEPEIYQTMRPEPTPAPTPQPRPVQTAMPTPPPRAASPRIQKDEYNMVGNNDKVDLKAVKFESFDNSNDYAAPSEYGRSNIDLIIDVPLSVTVVLGKTKKSIKEILEFGRGSVIVLDRLAGEMVDVLVNGKVFARGEVVVIDENYGVRITELTSEQNKEEE